MLTLTMSGRRTTILSLFVIFAVLKSSAADGLQTQPACELFESTDIDEGVKYDNGSIVYQGIVYPRRYQFMYIPTMYPSDFDNTTLPVMEGDSFINSTIAFIPTYAHIRGCICKLRTCVRKCCPSGSSLEDRRCIENTKPPVFKPDLWFYGRGVLKKKPWDSRKYKYVIGNTCINGSKYELDPTYSTDENYLYENGSLHVPNFMGEYKFLDHKSYCIDFTRREDSPEWILETHLCTHTEAQLMYDVIFNIFPIGLIISIVFLILTFLVYLILPELHTIHGMALMHYVGAMAIAYSFLAAIQTGSKNLGDMECFSYGVICYISFLLSFFWLNVMSFDIWWAFSGKGGFRGGVREAERKKFLCYLCYTWFGTLLIVSITMGMQFHPSIPETYSPGFGIRKCWLQDSALFPYFYLPMLLLIVANMILFGATAFKIISIKRETQMLRQEGSTKHTSNPKFADDTQRFWLYVKLFVVMGVNWSMEILSWAAGGSKWLWIVTDVFNSIQGLLIFLIFVFKPKIKKLLIRRYYTLRGKPIPSFAATTRSVMSNSSNVTQVTSSNGKIHLNKLDNEIQMEKALLK